MDRRVVHGALDFLVPWSNPQAKWPHAQIAPPPWATFARLLSVAFSRTGERRYAEAWGRLPAEARDDPENVLLYPVAR